MEENEVTAMATLARSEAMFVLAITDPSRQVRLIIKPLDDATLEPWWTRIVEARLQHLASLNDDWDSHGARRPSPDSMLLAVRIIAALIGNEQRPLPQIVPTRRGGIQLEWHLPTQEVEITIDPGDAVWAYLTTNGTESDGPLTEQEANVTRILNHVAHQ